ncbi:branched-chain amino acid ABC transporter permease [Herbiconiux sp. KACC 21604]|uniref:branched-chain amino acid ABC transporter permease n=1 Tax=unclassified Herbiconiux TaxID=2618217 RepID=UPI001490BD28|nr:branched-chain amino acid ABC transporter permease [Herbiconiux sp. SALV-R1]QJU55640.1 branched-chain amino acid ABC transporter permease [Herbiconiux sp. SALV-R1]WPO86838.1 branched-chain amino acid ABC transporter permease [Herbiconiux sp. KACC 21604]
MTAATVFDAIARPAGRRAMMYRSIGTLVVLATVLLALSGVLGKLQLDLLTTLLLYIAAASAWNIIGGFAGQFSLANSAFIGTGAYATVLILRDLGWGVVPALLASAVCGAVLALVMGAILFRLRDAYFTIGSMAVALAALIWMSNWDVTGAATGIAVPMSEVPGRSTLYLLAVVVAVVAVGVCIAVYHSAFGLRLMAVRDDQDVADSLGLSPVRLKLAAIGLSGAITAAAGGCIAVQQITIEPFSSFSINWSMTFIVMAIVGGLGRVWGPTIGAVIIYYVITVQLRNVPTLSILIEGALLIVLIKVLPGGILGGVGRLVAAVGRRLDARRPASSADPAAASAARTESTESAESKEPV